MEVVNSQMEPDEIEPLLTLLEERFKANPCRHKGIDWKDVQSRLESSPQKLLILKQMERSGGEPDVIGCDSESHEITFCDCSPESPIGRRSLCYDADALESRKKNKPSGSAVGMAAFMGIQLLTEAEYHALQTLGAFDLKTSSWVATPDAIRSLGGALFCDRRYNKIFTYHNGADSYYSSRGFRGLLKV